MSSDQKIRFFIIAFVLAQATTYVHTEEPEISTRAMRATGCDRSTYSFNCLKIDLVQLVDKISTPQEYHITNGLSVVYNPKVNQSLNADLVAGNMAIYMLATVATIHAGRIRKKHYISGIFQFAELARTYPHDRQGRLNAFVLAKLTAFMRSHSLNIQLLNGGDLDEAQSAVETGRRSDKKNKNLSSIITAALMMKGMCIRSCDFISLKTPQLCFYHYQIGMLFAMAMAALAAMAGKALLAAKMALLLSAITSLKSLTSSKHSTTYEIITKPAHQTVVHDSGHDHSAGGVGSSGYGRSMNFELPEHLT